MVIGAMNDADSQSALERPCGNDNVQPWAANNFGHCFTVESSAQNPSILVSFQNLRLLLDTAIVPDGLFQPEMLQDSRRIRWNLNTRTNLRAKISQNFD